VRVALWRNWPPRTRKSVNVAGVLITAICDRPGRHADHFGGHSAVSRRPIIKTDHISHMLHSINVEQGEST
jgi:hypothetical protein